MSISGLVVHALPERAEELRARLVELEGVEVHAIGDDGRLVVTVDVANDHQAADTLMDMQKQDGVLSASLIYNHFENNSGQSPAEKEQAR